MRTAVYAGTFDPITNGHVWMIRAGVITVFLMPPRAISEVSSSMVKGLVGPQGWEATVCQYVPAKGLEAFRQRQQVSASGAAGR
jgi:phosphopantetheine adenylyltransferase